ncbi:synaptonemal complex protein 3-like [Hipposideros larvatus]
MFNQKLGHTIKKQKLQRQKLFDKYSQEFQTLFQGWSVDIQNTKGKEEKLANLFLKQRKIVHCARIIQIQRLRKVENVFKDFLKSMKDLDKADEHLLINANSELRQ